MSVSVEVPQNLGGESVTEAIVAAFTKSIGDFVEAEEVLVELETDKISVDVVSPVSGTITAYKFEIDDTVAPGDVIVIIEPGEGAPAGDVASSKPAAEAAPAASGDGPALSPAVQRVVTERGLDPSAIKGTGPGGRILKEDAVNHGSAPEAAPAPAAAKPSGPPVTSSDNGPREERVRMTKLRQTIARRLVEAQQNAAMLTTFNEVDMTNIMAMRKSFQDRFVKRHGTKVGFMSFFVKAVVEALKEFPAVNAEIDLENKQLVYKNYYHVGIAVGGGKGLVVPIVRDADQLSFAEIELEIKRLAGLAQSNKLTLDNLQGGTFTISNGGIYGSMLSTPILNPPQSGILGMHNIMQRPVVVDGEVVARPMMYLALSYDHRIVDGREAVGFLVRIKECLENPERILLEV